MFERNGAMMKTCVTRYEKTKHLLKFQYAVGAGNATLVKKLTPVLNKFWPKNGISIPLVYNLKKNSGGNVYKDVLIFATIKKNEVRCE